MYLRIKTWTTLLTTNAFLLVEENSRTKTTKMLKSLQRIRPLQASEKCDSSLKRVTLRMFLSLLNTLFKSRFFYLSRSDVGVLKRVTFQRLLSKRLHTIKRRGQIMYPVSPPVLLVSNYHRAVLSGSFARWRPSFVNLNKNHHCFSNCVSASSEDGKEKLNEKLALYHNKFKLIVSTNFPNQLG